MPVATSPKPVVFALYELSPEIIEYGHQFFDFVPYDSPRAAKWKTEAEGILVRSQDITAEDAKTIGPQLKYVCKHGVGVDQIDVAALAQKGVVVMNAAGVNAGAVAELTLGLMLSLARNIPAIDRRVRAGQTVSKAGEGAVGIQLSGKSFGIIGGGNIGSYVGKMLRGALDAKIYLYDPYLSPAMEQKWADLVPSTHFHRVAEIKDMLPYIHVLTLHVPLYDGTRDLIGEEELRLMQPGSILVNAARGGVVNETALLKALDEGWIAAAGLDAFAIEPPMVKNYARLIAHDRVISLPHIGAGTLDIIHMTAKTLVDQMVDAFSGKPLRNVVERN